MPARLAPWRKVAETRPDSMPSPVETRSSVSCTLGELVRTGDLVELRRHTSDQRLTFARWYADPEIAEMLRHDLMPLTSIQALGTFDSIIMPSTRHGTCWAIHERTTGQLIGTTALTDVDTAAGTSLFRLLIGEKQAWGHGYGTEATRLVLAEAFLTWRLREVRLEVFEHNPRAQRAYQRAGFVQTGCHTEWVARARREIQVHEMWISRAMWEDTLHLD